MDKFTEKKFILATIIALMAGVLRAFGMLDGSQVVTMVLGSYTVFAAGDVGQQWLTNAPPR